MDITILLFKIACKTIKYLVILYILALLILYGLTFSPNLSTKGTSYDFLSLLLEGVTRIDFANTAPYLVTAPANLADDRNTLNYKVKMKYRYEVDLKFCMTHNDKNIYFRDTKLFNLSGAYYSIIIKKSGDIIYNKVLDITYRPNDIDAEFRPHPHYSSCGSTEGYASMVFHGELFPGEYQVIISPINKENNINIFGSEIRNGNFTIQMHPDMSFN